MLPYLKYYVALNVAYGKPVIPCERPSLETYETLKGYEPTKITKPYEEWADFFVVTENEHRRTDAESMLTIRKVGVDENNQDTIVAEIEKLEDFVRWV